MPEIPDLTIYQEQLESRLSRQPLRGLRIASPFVLRTVSPAPEQFVGRSLQQVRRLAKQLVFDFGEAHYAVVHLMISGRFQWRAASDPPAAIPRGRGLLAFDFDPGTLVMTEASKKKRASLRLVAGEDELAALNPGGLEVRELTLPRFAAQLRGSSHTLKRALTDQRVFAGIGNAYSDEILHDACLSPFKRSATLKDEEVEQVFRATCEVLDRWTALLRDKTGDRFPGKVTAFHDEMAVHGKYRQPCPRCAAPVQRIQYAENEANYCARCQTGGRLLADRSLSRLLKDNWPKRIEDLEA
jgi:formamidopyrimidine-DNA glycosylase